MRRQRLLVGLVLIAACVPEEEAAISSTTPIEINASDEAVLQKRLDAFRSRLPELKKIQARLEQLVFEADGVRSVGIGIDEAGEDYVFRVEIVDEQLRRRMPTTFEGVPVRIDSADAIRLTDGGPNCASGVPCHSNQTPYPVQMGNSGAWTTGNSACTLGFKACDRNTRRAVVVTNSHCAQFAGSCVLAPIGANVQHVSPSDQPPGAASLSIGQIDRHAAPSCQSGANYVDATTIDSAALFTSKRHRDIGPQRSALPGILPGWTVQYSGRSVGHNRGKVVTVNTTVNVPSVNGFCCGALTMLDQIRVDMTYNMLPGDSGSGLLSDIPGTNFDNTVVGLMWGADGSTGFANSIDRVMTALDLTFDSSVCLL